MKLIGAGLPRTGTRAQKSALEDIIGLGPTYHMVDVWADLSPRIQQWSEAFEGNADWGKIFEGFEATVDWPGSFHWRELVDVYPDAKVILSVRSGESWAESMRTTIWAALYGDTLLNDLSSARAKVDPGWAKFRDLMKVMWEKSGLLGAVENGFDAAALAAAMEAHNDEVREVIAPERLLVWSPYDGLEPVCKFLDVPIQKVDTPRVNNESGFGDQSRRASLDFLNQWQASQEILHKS
ncbi:sulfotransferase family protein [Streptomyces albidoflavus]